MLKQALCRSRLKEAFAKEARLAADVNDKLKRIGHVRRTLVCRSLSLVISLRLLSAFVVITLISFAVSAQQYPIRLDRPEKAGDRYHLVATSTETTTADATVSDQFLRKTVDVVTLELSADVTILEAASNS